MILLFLRVVPPFSSVLLLGTPLSVWGTNDAVSEYILPMVNIVILGAPWMDTRSRRRTTMDRSFPSVV